MLWLHVPGFARPDTETRYGSGQVLTDFKHWLVTDAFMSKGKQKIISFLKKNKVKNPHLLLTHAHGDHGDGFFDIMDDSYFTPAALYCYDPESLRLGLRNNEGSAEVKKDIEYLYKLINKAKRHGIPVIYLNHGDNIQLGDIQVKVYREQPARVEDDDTKGWDYTNSGSLCSFYPELYYWTSGDGPDKVCELKRRVGAHVVVFEISHHGNNCNRPQAAGMKADGAILCWYSDLEPNGIGTTEFTQYGARRCKEAGLTVFDTIGDINALFFGRKSYWYHAGKCVTYTCAYAGNSVLRSLRVDVTRAILRGEYGSGDERITNIIAAGYGPKQAQTKVNKVIEIAAGIKAGKLDYGKGDARRAKIDQELGKGYGQLVQDYINVLYGIRKAV